MSNNIWQEQPNEIGLVTLDKYRTFVEYTTSGRKTGRIKYVYPNIDATSNCDYVYTVVYDSRDATG